MENKNIGYRVVLGKRNSEWGIIINRYSGNRMENILSFDNEDLRDEFINKNVFLGNNYKELINKSKYKSSMRIDGLTATFKVNIRDEKETVAQLLDKDFAVIEKNGIYSFWAIIGTVESNGIIVYQAEKDIFINRDIRKMFKNSKNSKIIRGMVNRVYKDNDNLIPDFRENSKLLFSEDIDNSISESNMCLDEIIDIEKGEEYYVYFINSINNYKFLSGINNNYANMTEYITFTPFATSNPIPTGYLLLNGNGNFFNNDKQSSSDYRTYTEDFSINNYDYFYCIGVSKQERENNKTIFKALESCESIYKVEKHYLDNIKSYEKKEFKVIYHYGDKFRIDIISLGNLINIRSSDLINIYNDNNIYSNYVYDNDIKKEFLPEQETKILKGIYTPWYLCDSQDNKFNLYREFMNKNLEIDLLDSFSPYFNHKVCLIKSDNSKIYNGDFKYGIKYDSIIDNSILRKSNSYGEQYIKNSTQLEYNQRIQKRNSDFEKFSSIVNLISGITQTGIGIFSGGGIGGLNIGNGISNISSSIQNFNSSNDNLKILLAQQQDLKNTPNKLIGNSNNEMVTNKLSNNSIFLVKQKLLSFIYYSISQYFHIYGYNINSIWDNPNNYLNTRYYFDYLKIESIYENFNEEISGPERQVILNSLANGIHIWYVRDLETFKGIKNFNVNNVEMEFLNE